MSTLQPESCLPEGSAISPTSTSGATNDGTVAAASDNSVKNERKKKSIIPKIFGSRKSGKGSSDGDNLRPETDEVIFDLENNEMVAARRKAFIDASPIMRKSFSERQADSRIDGLNLSSLQVSVTEATEVKEIRIFVGTWNVGGRTPNNCLNLEEFLQVEGSSDIYVLGFQEIVPLSAGNVLMLEDNEPAARWLVLINQALNRSSNGDSSGSSHNDWTKHSNGSKFFHKSSLKLLSRNFQADGSLLKACNCLAEHYSPIGERRRQRKLSDSGNWLEFLSFQGRGDSRMDDLIDEALNFPVNSSLPRDIDGDLCYRLIVSRQMVGIFLTVWARSELVPHIGHLRLCSVGRGIMGCLGNKGCISMSMSLHETSFCFVCCHLASGEKEGDELRRNADVTEILKSAIFSKICKNSDRQEPERIIDHDRIIWMGDLNYRVSLTYEETKTLLEENDWDAMLEKDQLNTEREAGRVFNGFREGRILFAPTYKYYHNSDSYAGEMAKSKKKRRTPAWCDRILWRGDGIEQLSYIRGESRFSDHRPVCSVFTMKVQVNKKAKFRKGYSCVGTRSEYSDTAPHTPHQRQTFHEFGD
ncbi:hypothetical protein SAY87_026849 [Trapa incisa]|uniref:Inositol polyphosphate-related phosphatase domain-containing protein n=1 Tax=Trapa incisa TaxID=236973 RepID=A0AAN7H049_9MYRT|nr:hypothetical protein SAY87_026849 [Trapa incisa]